MANSQNILDRHLAQASRYRLVKGLLEENGVYDFVLFELVERNRPPWRNFKLVRARRARKRTWWLGWNGNRFARNRDVVLLVKNLPAVHDWVRTTLARR